MKRVMYRALAVLSLTTITTIEAVRSIKWNLHNDTDISGTKEIGQVWTNLKDCQQACAELATCGAVVEYQEGEFCILYELSKKSEPYKSEQATSYIAEIQGVQSESSASNTTGLFGSRQPSYILDPWAHYARSDLGEAAEIASYDVDLQKCKLLCLLEQTCTGVVVSLQSVHCSLRQATMKTYLKPSFYQDTYSKDLQRMYSYNTMPVFGETLDVVILYDVGWKEMVKPPTALWTEWGPCMGECGTQLRSRGCTGKSCRGSAVQVCLNKTICCTYQKSAGLSPSILIPLYVNPSYNFRTCTQIDFNAVAKACQGATVVLNVDNGPGYHLTDAYIQGFRTCVSHIGNHGVRSLGYVHTKSSIHNPATGHFEYFGFRDYGLTLRDVQTWVRLWGNLPGFSGFFIDEVSTAEQAFLYTWGINHVAWYQRLINNIKQINPKLDIVLNSGGVCPIELMVASQAMPLPASTVVIYEGNHTHWSEHCRAFEAGPYCGLPADNIVTTFRERIEYNELQGSALLYGTTREAAISALEVARQHNLAYFYASLINMPKNVWGAVPEYFNDILEILNSY